MKDFKNIFVAAGIYVSFTAGFMAVSHAADSPVPTAPPAAPVTGGFLQQLNDSFTAIYDKVAPSVVIIDATKKDDPDEESMDGLEFFFRNPRGGNDPRQRMPQLHKSEGSGFIVRPDGYIFTNNHVVEGADKVTVRLKDGRHFTAKMVGTDDKSDIAVIKIDATGLPAVQFADSDTVKVGQMICSIGTPFNLDYSFAFGWVSGKGRSGLTPQVTMYEDYIQTDSFVNPGDSGGPVLDVNGHVVGMNTLINGIGRKLTFAIPSNMLQDFGNQIIANGKVAHSWLGIGIYTLGEEAPLGDVIKGIDHGVVVSKIDANAPALKSDLRVADVITQVDGKEVATAHELQKEILKKKVGQNVDLTVWRDGKSIKVAVATGEIPADLTKVANNMAPQPRQRKAPDAEAPKDLNDYGFKVGDLGKDAAAKLKLKEDTKGALVTDVQEGSAASVAGLQHNDVVTGVDSVEVTDAASFNAQMDKHEEGKPVLLFINRGGQKTYAILKPSTPLKSE